MPLPTQAKYKQARRITAMPNWENKLMVTLASTLLSQQSELLSPRRLFFPIFAKNYFSR